MDDYKNILESMGYREVRENCFLKPIGFSCLVAHVRPELEEIVLALCSKRDHSNPDKLLWWTHRDVPISEFNVDSVKDFEYESREGLLKGITNFELCNIY